MLKFENKIHLCKIYMISDEDEKKIADYIKQCDRNAVPDLSDEEILIMAINDLYEDGDIEFIPCPNESNYDRPDDIVCWYGLEERSATEILKEGGVI